MLYDDERRFVPPIDTATISIFIEQDYIPACGKTSWITWDNPGCGVWPRLRLEAEAVIVHRRSAVTILLLTMLAFGHFAAPAEAVLQFDIPAESALLMEAGTGQILWAKNPDMITEPASLAKMMVMLLTLEAVDRGIASWSDRVVTSSYAASVGGSSALLAPGESFTLREMMLAIAIHSANDATVAVAEHLATTEEAFVEAMNRRAQELGMTNTFFINSDGLPAPEGQRPNQTTARDMAILARELITRFPEVLELTSIDQYRLRQGSPTRPPFDLINTNRLFLRYEGADGLKTGWTNNAGYNLVATAQRNGIRLISVVLRTDSEQARAAQTIRLMDYGFDNFRWHTAVPQGQSVGNVNVPDAVREQVPVRTGADLRVFVHRSDADAVRIEIEPRANLTAPIAVNDVVGEVVAYLGDQELARVPALAATDVERANFLVRGWRWLREAVSGQE